MKLVKLKDAVEFSNSNKCIGLEYPLNEKDINFATATISGRYPDHGYCMNAVCKELIYVMEGSGSLHKINEVIHFQKGDVILIDKKEVYYWDAHCTVMMPCVPAWYEEQHKLIDE